MPNTTAADRRDAATIGQGVSASQLRGWKDAGYGPAKEVSRPEFIDHFRTLAPLMGTGRNGNVAVLKMADAGRPCRRLPEVLRSYTVLEPGEKDSEDADDLIEYFEEAAHLDPIRSRLTSALDSLGPITEFPDPEEVKRALLGSAMLPFAQATVDEPLQPGDLADLSRAEDAIFAGMGVPVEWDSDDPTMLSLDLAVLNKVVGIVRASRGWIEDAKSIELVRGVRAAKVLLQSTEGIGVITFSSDEERWHWIGRSAPTAMPSLQLYSKVIDFIHGFPDVVANLPQSLYSHLTAMRQQSDEVLGRAGDNTSPDE